MPALGDQYGRWTIFQVTMIVQIPLFLFCIFTESLAVIYFALFYAGIVSIGRFTCGYLLLTELVPEKWEYLVGPGFLSGDAMMIIYLTIYFRYISQNSMPVFWAGLILNIFCMIMTMLFVPESPKWLVSVKQFEKARQAIYRIARYNGTSTFEMSTFKLEDDHLNSTEHMPLPSEGV